MMIYQHHEQAPGEIGGRYDQSAAVLDVCGFLWGVCIRHSHRTYACEERRLTPTNPLPLSPILLTETYRLARHR